METLNRLELAWGIQTFAIRPYKSAEEAMLQVEELLLRFGLVKKGDYIVFTLGSPVKEKAKTNTLKIHKVSQDIEATPNSSRPLRCRDYT